MHRNFYSLFIFILLPFLLQAQEMLLTKSIITSFAPDPKGIAKSAIAKTIYVSEISKNVGKRVNLCGRIFIAKELKVSEGKIVIVKMGGEYLNERFDVQLRFDEDAVLNMDLQKLLVRKNICITGVVMDAFDVAMIYIDSISASRLVEEAGSARPELNTTKVNGNTLKLLANAYMLEGPKWKMPIITHLKEGSIIKVEKVQPGWIYAKVITKNGNPLEEEEIYGYISYQALGLTRKGQVESIGKYAKK